MDLASAHRWFKRCLERAGLSTDWSLHDLRHSAADALYRVTGDIVLAQQLLRHADVRTTRGYLHPGSTASPKACERSKPKSCVQKMPTSSPIHDNRRYVKLAAQSRSPCDAEPDNFSIARLRSSTPACR
jgi:Phage integrase family